MLQTQLAISTYGQIIFSILSIALNLLFVFIVLTTVAGGLGFYKWMMIGYAIFEILYAATVLIGLPIHFVWAKTWIFFSYRGPLIGTPVAFLGSAAYCFFYEVWMGCVVVNFLYRYIAVCKSDWVHFIKTKLWLRALFCVLFLLFIAFCALCTMYWCAVNKITKAMEDKIVMDFGITNVKDVAYTMLRLFDINGNPSPSGISATATHFGIVLVSGVIIVFCAWNIWQEIRKMRESTRKIRLEKQLFVTLLVQTVIPVVLCHIPSAINLTYPFWDHVSFEPITPFFAMFTTIPKAIDPLIAMICIAEYRRSFLKLLGISYKHPISSVQCISTQDNGQRNEDYTFTS